MALFELNHPLIKHKVSILRNKNTSSKEFREIVSELSQILIYEATRNVALRKVNVPTWKDKSLEVVQLEDKNPIIVPVLRAGMGMVDGIYSMIPTAKFCVIGIYRNEETATPVSYYQNFVDGMEKNRIYIIDPMLATGGSVISTIDVLKKKNAEKISVLSIIGAPEGVDKILKKYPNIDIYLASLDKRLDENFYIIPGLGDAGDRIFNTQ